MLTTTGLSQKHLPPRVGNQEPLNGSGDIGFDNKNVDQHVNTIVHVLSVHVLYTNLLNFFL